MNEETNMKVKDNYELTRAQLDQFKKDLKPVAMAFMKVLKKYPPMSIASITCQWHPEWICDAESWCCDIGVFDPEEHFYANRSEEEPLEEYKLNEET